MRCSTTVLLAVAVLCLLSPAVLLGQDAPPEGGAPIPIRVEAPGDPADRAGTDGAKSPEGATQFAECDVYPTDLYFNVSEIGVSQQLTFTISNECLFPMPGSDLVGSVTAPCAEFTVSPGNFDLWCYDSQVFTVTYTPTDYGDDFCEIIISANETCNQVQCTAAGPVPACDVSPTALEFDVMGVGMSDAQQFTVTNNTPYPMDIDPAWTCAEFTVDPDFATLGVGESQEFTVTYTPEDCGDDVCTIVLAPVCEDVYCQASGPITPICSVSPEILDFDCGEIGDSDVEEFTITNVGCGWLEGLIGVPCSEFEVSPLYYNLGPGESENFEVTYTPQDCGNDDCTLEPDYWCPDILCRAAGPNTPVCMVEPTSLQFQVGEIGTSQTMEFHIINDGCGELVGEFQVPCSEFVVYPPGYNLAPGEASVFYVTYIPRDCGNDVCTIGIGPGCEDLLVRTVGPATPSSSVVPTALTFQSGEIGSSDIQQFAITNDACGVLTGTVTESCVEFSVAPGAYNLGPGESQIFTVTYTPADLGNDQCTIQTGPDCANVVCTATGPETECDLAPTSLSFHVDEIGMSDQAQFTLTNNSHPVVPYYGNVTWSGDEFTVTPTFFFLFTTGSTQTFTVTYTPSDCGNDECVMDLGFACGEVTCTATGPTGNPACFVAPTNLAFECGLLGEVRFAEFTISNVGDCFLTGNIDVACGAFTVEPMAYNLGPSETEVFQVTFTCPEEPMGSCTIGTGSLCENVLCHWNGSACWNCPSHFDWPTNTGETYNIFVQSATWEGAPLPICSEIAVYDGDFCVGAACWEGEPVGITAWGAVPPVSEGYTCGNPMSFRIWNSEKDAYCDAEAAFLVGSGDFCDDLYSRVTLNGTCCCEMRLSAGWNCLTGCLAPVNPELGSVWEDAIAGGVLNLLKNDCSGVFCLPDWCPYDWDPMSSYMVHLASSYTLTLCGGVIPEEGPVSLGAGWNCLPYLPQIAHAPMDAMASCWDQVAIVRSACTGEFCIPNGACNMPAMEPGQGYMAYLNAPCELYYPTMKGQSPRPAAVPRREPEHFIRVQYTGSNYVVVVRDVEGGLQEGDEVGVFSEDLCVGAAVWGSDPTLGITVWGDDVTTETTDGCLPGDALSFKVWRSANSELFAPKAEWTSGNGTYGDGPYGEADLRMVLAVDPEDPARYRDFLAQNCPNPFNPVTVIPYELSRPCRVLLRIFDVQGNQVRVLVDRTEEAGRHEATWNGRDAAGRDVSPGIYFYRMETGHFQKMRKMVLVK